MFGRDHRRRLSLGLGAALLCASGLAAQQTFRAGVELVSLNVTVTEGARYVTDLTESDFAVYEDGAQQSITFFSRVQQPIALAILLDTSASMEEKLPTAQEAAVGFTRRMRPEDTMEVIDFDSQVRILQEFTNDARSLEKAIEIRSSFEIVPEG